MMIDMSPQRATALMTTSEAAAHLGVKPASLYSYVSRGLLARTVGPDGRSSRFDAGEVDRLARRGKPRRSSRDPSVEIVVQSSITRIPSGPSQRHGHEYRGQQAFRLAERATFEEVAGLLVTGELRALTVEPTRPRRGTTGPRDPLAAMRVRLDSLPSLDPSDLASPEESLEAAAGQVLGAVLGPPSPHLDTPALVLRTGRSVEGSVAARLAVELSEDGVPPTWVVEAINVLLIVMADHDLAPATLAARLAASTRAAPAACVVAALATLSGPLHGGASELVRSALDRPDPLAFLVGATGTGPVPGFGHFLYPGGDPRTTIVFDRVRRGAPEHPVTRAAERVGAQQSRRSGPPPNIDLAIAALMGAGGLRPGAGAALFAVARTAGWLAHIAEEFQAPPLRFRPRAIHTSPGAESGDKLSDEPGNPGQPV